MAHALHKADRSPTPVGEAILDRVRAVREQLSQDPARPSITLAYAQSLDGCIAEDAGMPTVISNRESQTLTHHLRAMHDALLVGVNTVIVDDPRLNVRLVPGSDPIPVVVDSRLRIPLEAQLLKQDARALVATVFGSCEKKRAALAQRGVDVLHVEPSPDRSVDLADLFARLRQQGIRSVLVEGGAKIITSILAAELADQLVLTISPQFLGGVRSVEPLFGRGRNRRPGLTNVYCESVGDDLIVQGEFVRSTHGPS